MRRPFADVLNKLIQQTLIMKQFIILLTACTFSFAGIAQKQQAKQPILKHVVIFKFKDSSSPADVQHVAETFAALYGKVPQIKAFEWGINNSPEHFNEGFTHCFTLSFSSEKDLADYQLQPAHLEFQKVL